MSKFHFCWVKSISPRISLYDGKNKTDISRSVFHFSLLCMILCGGKEFSIKWKTFSLTRGNCPALSLVTFSCKSFKRRFNESNRSNYSQISFNEKEFYHQLKQNPSVNESMFQMHIDINGRNFLFRIIWNYLFHLLQM